uniref:Magnesium transport protein CorA n=1 Tax=Ganoderma boninense TaxID=34458 RepID=A0A5K1K3X5_9APHY|nr:Magnesium transport protein CorA [Ganoderma boninense]
MPDILPTATSLYLDQVNRYISFASMTYSMLEIVSTLPDEVELIWPAKRGVMKTIFLINKYSPLIDFTLLAWVDLVAREPDVRVHVDLRNRDC